MSDLPKRLSLVAQAAEILRQDLRQGVWKDFLPGEIPLARRLQVGRSTVRAALHVLQREGWLAVTQGQRRRVRKRSASRSPPSHKRTVAILTGLQPHALSPFRLFLINELQGSLHEVGYRIEVVTHPPMATRHSVRGLEKLAGLVGAVCWVLLGPNSFVQRWFLQHKIPCMGVGATPDAVLIPYLRVDYRAAARHAAGMLLARGHRRIALTISRASPKGEAMLRAGFLDGFADAKDRVHGESLVLYHNGTVPGFCAMLQAQFASEAKPDALLISNPRDTLTAMSGLMHDGKRVPEDVSVIALGHDPALDCVVPSVANYGIDWPVFARKLSRMVLELVQTGTLPLRETLVMPEFQAGGSLGMHRGREESRAKS